LAGFWRRSDEEFDRLHRNEARNWVPSTSMREQEE
jgi:hypothetical protein